MHNRLKACLALVPPLNSNRSREQEHIVELKQTDLNPCCCRMANFLRSWISKNRKRYTEDGFNLDLCYVTKRIIAMGYPAEGGQGLFRNPRSEIVRFLRLKHTDHYRVYNLCVEKMYDPNSFGGHVVCYPFEDHQVPSLSMMSEFCEDAERWLLAHPENTVVVHCKAGKGRTGVMICALLMHMGVCKGPDEALRLFAHRRTADDRGVTIPSQRRYIQYFYQSMVSGMRLSPARLVQLQYIRLTGFSKSMLSRIVVCLYRRNTQTKEIVLLSEIKSASGARHAANNVRSISPSRKSSLALFPPGERYHLLVNNQEFYVIFENDAGASPRWMIGGDFKLHVFEDTRPKKSSLFFTWLNTNCIGAPHLRFRRHELDKVNRCLPNEVQMEVQLSDLRPQRTGSYSGRSHSRTYGRFNSLPRAMSPSNSSRRINPRRSPDFPGYLVASFMTRASFQDEGGPSSRQGIPRSNIGQNTLLPPPRSPSLPRNTEESWANLTQNWDNYWMSTREHNPSISQKSCQ